VDVTREDDLTWIDYVPGIYKITSSQATKMKVYPHSYESGLSPIVANFRICEGKVCTLSDIDDFVIDNDDRSYLPDDGVVDGGKAYKYHNQCGIVKVGNRDVKCEKGMCDHDHLLRGRTSHRFIPNERLMTEYVNEGFFRYRIRRMVKQKDEDYIREFMVRRGLVITRDGNGEWLVN